LTATRNRSHTRSRVDCVTEESVLLDNYRSAVYADPYRHRRTAPRRKQVGSLLQVKCARDRGIDVYEPDQNFITHNFLSKPTLSRNDFGEIGLQVDDQRLRGDVADRFIQPGTAGNIGKHNSVTLSYRRHDPMLAISLLRQDTASAHDPFDFCSDYDCQVATSGTARDAAGVSNRNT
jgi:hypothetical protein